MFEKHTRIGTTTAAFMIGVAFTLDGLQGMLGFIPFVGQLINTFVTIIGMMWFWLWFKLNNIGFLDRGGAKALTFFGTGLFELIPFFNILPALTAGVILTILMVRVEDMVAKRKIQRKETAPEAVLS